MEVEIVRPAPSFAVSSAAAARKGKGMGLSGGGWFFTEADLAAADQLVQLSVSGETAGAASSPTSTSSSSLQSVNNKCYHNAAADDGGGAGEAWVDRRARKRYRLVVELYDATRPVTTTGAAGAGGGKRGRSSEEAIDHTAGSGPGSDR